MIILVPLMLLIVTIVTAFVLGYQACMKGYKVIKNRPTPPA